MKSGSELASYPSGTELGDRRQSFRQWYLVVVIMFIGVSAQIDRHIMPMLAIRMKSSLSLSDEQVGLLLGFGFSATYALSSVVMGYLGDRFSRKWVLCLSVFTWSMLTGLCAAAKSFPPMFAARLGVGMAESALAPNGYTMAGAAFPPEHRALPVAIATAGSPVGLVIAPILIGTIVHMVGDRTVRLARWLPPLEGWQLAFLVCAGLGLIAVILLSIAREPAGPATSSEPAVTIPEAWRHFWQRKRYFAAVFFSLPFLATANYALIAWMPSYLERTFGLNTLQIGVYQSIGFIPAALVAPLVAAMLGRYVERSRTRRIHFRIMLGLAPIAGALIAVPFLMPTGVSASIAFAFPVFVTSIIISFGMINVQALVDPRYRAQATAIGYSSFLLLGSGLGPTLVGVLTTRVFGEKHLSLAVIVCLVVFVPLSSLISYFALRNPSPDQVPSG